MTKEEWTRVEQALTGTSGVAKLLVDGRDIVFQRQLVGNNRLGIMMFIDGSFSWKWCINIFPEQKYLKRQEKFLYSTKTRAEFKKLSKRDKNYLAKDHAFNADKKIVSYSPIWNSGIEIRRHYQKTFSSIELVETVG